MTTHVSLERANLNSFIISAPDFHILQHIGSSWSITHIQKLADVLEIPITKLYSHLIGQSKPILPFEINRSSEEEGPSLIGKFRTYPGTYMGFHGTIFSACMGIYYLKNFWCRPTSSRCWPYSPALSWHTTVDDNVEAAPIYRSGGKAENPVRPNQNHDLHMEWEGTRPESHCKQSVLSKAVPGARSLATKTKIKGTWLECITNCKT